MPKKPFRHPLKALRRFLGRKPAAGKKKIKAPLEDEVETRADAARAAKAMRDRAKNKKDKDAAGRKKAGKKDGKKGKKKSRAPRPGRSVARGGFAVPPLSQGVPTRPPAVLDLPVQSLLRAASFAARKHMGQKRADGVTPYFSHVSRVTLILSHVFGVRDEELLTAALLHDTLEDTATDYDEIEDHFGARVADMVVLLTKNNMMPKERREDEYAARLIAAPEPGEDRQDGRHLRQPFGPRHLAEDSQDDGHRRALAARVWPATGVAHGDRGAREDVRPAGAHQGDPARDAAGGALIIGHRRALETLL